MAERDLIGEHIDGCYAKMRYVQEQFIELRKTIAGIDNEDAKVSLFLSMVPQNVLSQKHYTIGVLCLLTYYIAILAEWIFSSSLFIWCFIFKVSECFDFKCLCTFLAVSPTDSSSI